MTELHKACLILFIFAILNFKIGIDRREPLLVIVSLTGMLTFGGLFIFLPEEI